MRNENRSSRIGSLSGVNHSAGIAISALKNVFPMTVTASPKKLPNIAPQKTVEMPQYRNIFRNFRRLSSMFLNFASAMPQPITMRRP